MPRASRSVAGLCIAVIALAAFLPGIGAFDCALLEPQWVLLPDDTPVAFSSAPAPVTEQPRPLHSTLVSRGPPSLSLL